jgi:hypothetical protein
MWLIWTCWTKNATPIEQISPKLLDKFHRSRIPFRIRLVEVAAVKARRSSFRQRRFLDFVYENSPFTEEKSSDTESGTDGTNVSDVSDGVSETEVTDRILSAISNNPKTTYTEIATLLSLNRRTIQRRIQKLKRDGKLRRIGPERSGRWEVVK